MTGHEPTFRERVQNALAHWCAAEEGDCEPDDIVECDYEDQTTYCGEGTCEMSKVVVTWKVQQICHRGTSSWHGRSERCLNASEFVNEITAWMNGEMKVRP